MSWLPLISVGLGFPVEDAVAFVQCAQTPYSPAEILQVVA